jgi:hypothetical protein
MDGIADTGNVVASGLAVAVADRAGGVAATCTDHLHRFIELLFARPQVENLLLK